MGRDILFQVTKGYFCFSQGVNSSRGHESSLFLEETRLFRFEIVLTFTI